MYLSLSEALKCYIRDTSWIMREIHSNTYDRYIQIHMLDALSRHTVKSGLTRGIVYLLRIQCGINVFLRKRSAAWYRLQNTSWHKSEGGAREGLLFLDVSWMYFVCILTSPQQRAWRCGDTWIIHGPCYGSHNTPTLVGYVWDTS